MANSTRTQKPGWQSGGDRAGFSVPEPWYTYAKEAGFGDPVTGEPSIQGIARGTGVAAMTVSHILKKEYGTRGPSPSVLKKFSEGFGVGVEEVTDYLGIGWGSDEPWERPSAADYLSKTDGLMVTKLILRLTQEARRGTDAAEFDEPVDVDEVPARKARATKVARRPAKATGAVRRRG